MENHVKNIAVINGCDFGSTGTISSQIINYISNKMPLDFTIYVSDKRTNNEKVVDINKNKFLKQINRIAVKIFGDDGFRNKANTKKLLKILKNSMPDLIHIHNLHGYYINMPMLLDFTQKNNIPVIWTLHDNWVFTGRCAFVPTDCPNFKNQCKSCSHLKSYPKTFFDKAHKYYGIKKNLFENKNIVFVSPSQWNKDLAKESLLAQARVEVINNGIDLTAFYPRQSNEKKVAMGVSDRFVILCAAYPWTERKGLSYINKLAAELDSSKFAIVMVGVTDDVETNENIIRHPRVSNQNELAEFYSMADVFLTPTKGDNYPTVDMESLACGTPVISFDTGGTKEIVVSDVGVVVPQDDYDGLKESIYKIYENPISKDKCYDYAKRFDKNLMLEAYLKLYMEMLKEG
ncbi:MAG: glycosyltransferase [Erysipelotrichales bacterium]|nr:glycosyltransferase [Erysipelotrichales bacterium]